MAVINKDKSRLSFPGRYFIVFGDINISLTLIKLLCLHYEKMSNRSQELIANLIVSLVTMTFVATPYIGLETTALNSLYLSNELSPQTYDLW